LNKIKPAFGARYKIGLGFFAYYLGDSTVLGMHVYFVVTE